MNILNDDRFTPEDMEAYRKWRQAEKLHSINWFGWAVAVVTLVGVVALFMVFGEHANAKPVVMASVPFIVVSQTKPHKVNTGSVPIELDGPYYVETWWRRLVAWLSINR